MFDEFGNYIGGANKGGLYSPKINQGFNSYLQGYPIQTIGGITNYNTSGFIPADVMANRRGFSSAPPTMQTEPSIGPVNLEYNMARESIAPIPSIPLSDMDLSGGKLAPGKLSGGAESIPPPSLVGPGIQSIGKVANMAGLASKANPYLAAGTAGLSILQAFVGARGLARSKQPEGYKEVPEMTKAIGEAEQAAQYGLGAQQIGLANQQARETQNAQQFYARSMAGGNMSRAIFGANTYNRLMAANQLAAQDQMAQERKVGIRNQLYAGRQRLADANTQLAQQNYVREQEANAGALRSGLLGLGGFFNLNQALRYNPSLT
jgi:hypothetical protein